MIDELLIDTDESGFELVLTGDFTDAFADYLAADPASAAAATVRLRLPHDAALQLAAQARTSVQPWADEYDHHLAAYQRATPAERRAVLAGVPLDDNDAFDAADERLRESVDLARKAARENA